MRRGDKISLSREPESRIEINEKYFKILRFQRSFIRSPEIIVFEVVTKSFPNFNFRVLTSIPDLYFPEKPAKNKILFYD